MMIPDTIAQKIATLINKFRTKAKIKSHILNIFSTQKKIFFLQFRFSLTILELPKTNYLAKVEVNYLLKRY